MNRVERLLASPVGAIVAQPWFDRFSMHFLERWMFPASRLWAAARAAHGSVEEFYAQVPMQPLPRLSKRVAKALSRFEQVRKEVLAAEARWQAAFFNGDVLPEAARQAIEANRLARRTAYNELRRRFLFVSRHADVPSVRWALSSPMELAADYARVVSGEVQPFALPAQFPEITKSQSFAREEISDYWLRFTSPSAIADTVYARVSEPAGVKNPPTLIFLHGIGVEFDHWHGMVDEAARLVRSGFRVVRPEAPWHGRRVPDGRYGGEHFIATMPRGTLQFSSAQVRETAVLLRWCRANTDAAVVLGGSSLGAHMARIAAANAVDWPQQLQPDALFLITPCGRLEDAAIEGSFAKVWGTAEASVALGWSPVLRSKWLSIIDSRKVPVVPPDRIVTVIGEQDRVTPYASGLQLLRELQIPDSNIFSWPLGHFSIPINMVRDHRPLQRLQDIVGSLR